EEWDGPLSLFDIMKFQSSLREVMLFIKYSKDRENLSRILEANAKRFMEVERWAADVIEAITDKFRQIVDKAIEMTKGCNCSPSCLLGNVSDGYSTVHLKAVNKSDTYILAGVLQFTINVDCSAPAVFIYGCTTLRNDFQEASMLHGGLP
ncbi:MAG: hypothetical protein K2P38_01765, partial [Lachnospiraceae bacterium]|nr:hypothetical protein [Lachnospiraceae bacterium]